MTRVHASARQTRSFPIMTVDDEPSSSRRERRINDYSLFSHDVNFPSLTLMTQEIGKREQSLHSSCLLISSL